ncbi:hypothetical protein QBC36DRAFT_63471 [Triangularia setosa]|uniref:THUMP domain-containing protein n=1 Tax=Triangularia setosa TaxID=2587417 RepID=A0AAN6WFV6_9PEZI|nr:hypothetical protein QBC36DRAFT_63471 [Podospora setosa]
MAKAATHQESSLQAGEPGIWITCARHQESKAAREIGVLFAEYADKMYGIKGVHDAEKKEGEEDEDEDDIEAAIKKEVEALNANRKGTDGGHNMTALRMNVDCLMFVKTKPPIAPVAFVRRIVEDARSASETGQMKCRYVNRLTPVSVTGKATEQGLEAVAREALAPFFDLSGKKAGVEQSKEPAAKPATEIKGGNDAADMKPSEAGSDKTSDEAAQPAEKGFTFAIRPSVRNNSSLKRDIVINTIAGLINDERHKVNLTSPDKVILVDVYQKVCGISVVDGDWEELKRYNLTELYGQGQGSKDKDNEEKKKKKTMGGSTTEANPSE